MPIIGNPYYHHPQPAARQAADDVLSHIDGDPTLAPLFGQGKMLGILIVEPPTDDTLTPPLHDIQHADSLARMHNINNVYYLAAYSGVVNSFPSSNTFFVPPVYDLQQPDDFYLQRDAEISALNADLASLEAITPRDKVHDRNLRKQREAIRQQRKALSIALQRDIFSHFSFVNPTGQYRNVIDIFADAKRGLPPGGSGECAAPRLLQYAYEHHLRPVELAEFWYGRSPRGIHRVHGQFYPSCIEKCSPILSYMLPASKPSSGLDIIPSTVSPESPDNLSSTTSSASTIKVLYEDAYLIAVSKPKGLLSVPGKVTCEPDLETMVHQLYPDVKGPMLVHRLDQATSGIMLAAKDAQTHKALQQQFIAKTIHKRYVATLRRQITTTCGIISLPLTVNPDDRPRQVADWQFGKQAVTYYEVIDSSADTTTLHLYPLTGRTHQLRVHCASPFGLDAAIVGDRLYDILDDVRASSELTRTESLRSQSTESPQLRLHAEQITFIHPATGEQMTFTSPQPGDTSR